MKFLLAAAGLAILLSSCCRTVTPIDPNTGKPSASMLPQTYVNASK